MKRILSYILIFLILFTVPTFAEADTSSVLSKTASYIYQSTQTPTVGSVGGEWAIIGLARSGFDAPADYYGKYLAYVENYTRERSGILHGRKYTENSRVAAALAALGANPADVAGFDLLAPLADYERTAEQGLNGLIWALIALDCGEYENEAAMRDMYLRGILDAQLANGGWSLAETEDADADITAMALTALARYTERAEVSAAADRALTYLSGVQTESGGFTSGGVETSETCAQVIIALCSLGIPMSDARFVKSGNTAADSLLSFYKDSGTFCHTHGGEPNQMATEQALCALAALKRFESGENTLFDMSDAENVAYNENESGFADRYKEIKKQPVSYAGKTFSDIEASPYKGCIEALAERGIISGKSEELFDPNSTMTRAEFATIVVRGLGIDPRSARRFDDVNEGDWCFGYVAAAYDMGIVNGVSASEFSPNGVITREEAAVMIARAARLCGINKPYDNSAARDILAGFTDYTNASNWAREPLAFCYDNGILSNEDIEILPAVCVTRAEVASMLFKLLELAQLL